jgi:hypothetical protein
MIIPDSARLTFLTFAACFNSHVFYVKRLFLLLHSN